MLLKGFDMRKEARSFLLTLKGVTGMPFLEQSNQQPGGNPNQTQVPLQGSKYSLEYYLTFFNKEIGTHGSFYGRTHRTQAMPLRETGGTWDVNQEQYVYFHTSFTEKTSFAVVECVVVRELAGQRSYLSGGYALCNLFDFGGVTTVELNRGSPRLIG